MPAHPRPRSDFEDQPDRVGIERDRQQLGLPAVKEHLRRCIIEIVQTGVKADLIEGQSGEVLALSDGEPIAVALPLGALLRPPPAT